MKPYQGYQPRKFVAERKKLPAGGYVARIIDAEEEVLQWGSRLIIRFDISEGPYVDFFKKDYEQDDSKYRKWRGVYRLTCPKGDGSEKDEWAIRNFNGAIWAIEQSNRGYQWNWKESSLKGKVVGVLFRNKEWEMDTQAGKSHGWTTECCQLEEVDAILEERYTIPKDKPLDKAAKPATKPAEGFKEVNDGAALPWDTQGNDASSLDDNEDDVPF